MAKTENTSGYKGTGFIVAAIALFVVILINSIMMLTTYLGMMKIFQSTSQELSLANSTNAMLSSVDKEVLEIVADVGSAEGHINAISAQFDGIRGKLDAYEHMEGHDEMAARRFRHARAYIEAYDAKLLQYQDMLMTLDDGSPESAAFKQQMPSIFQQEIAPLQNAASEMLVSSISITSRATSQKARGSVRYVYITQTILAALLVLGEIAIFVFARYTKRSAEEIDRKNAQFAEASSKLMRSREKMEDIATINILTGMKNRYALEQDIGERLASEQFNIAVFDLDGFRQINDMYGYDFGDEYLSQIAERLKNEYSQYAELYNITGNEFCAVFNREVSDTQALHYVEGICNAMASPYTIFNLTVQLTASASTYHYVAGDCLNVNSLLVKLDNALRNAKRQGGGQIHQVMNI